MSAPKKLQPMSVADYLVGELVSAVKHEYLGGAVYAMAGARNSHNLIATNITGSLFGRLRGKKCRPCNSDTKIRLGTSAFMRFYYPDASVICSSNPPGDSFQDHLVVLFEVLSRKTRRIDEGEKKDAYLTIPSLCIYALVEQDMPAITAFRRTEKGFVREVHEGLDAVLPLGEVEIELPLADVYDRVEFTPEPEEPEV